MTNTELSPSIGKVIDAKRIFNRTEKKRARQSLSWKSRPDCLRPGRLAAEAGRVAPRTLLLDRTPRAGRSRTGGKARDPRLTMLVVTVLRDGMAGVENHGNRGQPQAGRTLMDGRSAGRAERAIAAARGTQHPGTPRRPGARTLPSRTRPEWEGFLPLPPCLHKFPRDQYSAPSRRARGRDRDRLYRHSRSMTGAGPTCGLTGGVPDLRLQTDGARLTPSVSLTRRRRLWIASR